MSSRLGMALTTPVEFLRVHLEPGRSSTSLDGLHRLLDSLDLLAPLANGHHVARLDEKRGDVDPLPVDEEVTVPHELARLRARSAEAEPEGHVVQPPLEQPEEVLAGDSALSISEVEIPSVLLLEQTVHPPDLLLLTKADAILREFDAPLAVLPRRIGAPVVGALVTETPIALESRASYFPAGRACRRVQYTVAISDPPSLWGTAPIVWNWGHVSEQRHFETRSLQAL